MSSILPLVEKLREYSPSELAAVLGRMVAAPSGSDLFDLSRQLLGRRELESRIRQANAKDLQQLAQGKATAPLRQLLLAGKAVFPEASELLGELESLPTPRMTMAGSALSAYETMLCITEILFALEQHWFDVMKTGLRAQDAKIVAEKFKWTNQDVQLRFRIAQRAKLVAAHEDRWVSTSRGVSWLSQDRQSAWLTLAIACWDLPKIKVEPGNLLSQLQAEYPLRDLRSLGILEFGAALGLINREEALEPLLGGSPQRAATILAKSLPKAEKRLVVQGDMTIVAPGPLDASLHRQLDSFADSEDLGLASRFRISRLSLSHHQETGGKLEDVSKLLTKASGKELPQPIGYAISQAKERFAAITVTAQGMTRVSSKDSILLTQLRNEKSLYHLDFKLSSGELTTKASAELCYFSLRESGYAAVMLSDAGKVVSPRFTAAIKEEVEEQSELELKAQALLNDEQKAADPSEISRQLTFALKNKLKVHVSVEMPDGSQSKLLLTPLGIAGSRLRGRDEEKQAERTLPIGRIRSVTLS